MTVTAHPALVLNADFRPMSYFPLSLLSWQDAVHAVFSERVSVVAEYDTWARSPSTQIRLPSVVALRKYQPSARRVAFTRFNVFLRDRFTCQYCGEAFPSSALTFEHVIPRSRGRPDDVVEHRHGLHAVQHEEGKLDAHQAPAPAQGADAQRAAGSQARVSARLSARELDGLPLLGRPARGVASSRSSDGRERRLPKAEAARSSRAETSNKWKAPLEWPATRLENGWAPQGVAFEPSAFRQTRCGRSRCRPRLSTWGGAEAAR
jgi:5-methylcytosine-specific restriction endonuclease McrA